MFKKFGCFVLTAAVFAFGSCANNQQTANVNSATISANSSLANAINSGASATNANAAANMTATNSAANSINAATGSASTANSSANSNSVVVGDVTRISFAKGASAGTENVTLAPNAAKQFAVEADYGQKIKVTTGSKAATVKMLSGTDRQVESAGGGLILEVNSRGDVIFEVKNTTAHELKTTVRAEVTKGY